jgi:glycosidase
LGEGQARREGERQGEGNTVNPLIHRAALRHENRLPYACPLGPTHLSLMAMTGQGEVERVTVRYRDRYAPKKLDAERDLRYEGSDGLHDYWRINLEVPTRRVQYHFRLEGGGERLWWGEHGIREKLSGLEPFQYAYLTTADLFQQPEWLRGVTIYQIFPDRFYNGDPANDPEGPRLEWEDRPRGGEEMAGGDLEGIRRKLKYLDGLGVGAFYMTPIFESSSNHKYNTADYTRIDPAFGTNELFRRLVREAHERGMRVLLDAVFNHSGTEFFAFQDVIEKGRESPYVSWFHRTDSFPVDPAIPNYETFATGLGYMPKLNTADPGCAEYFLEIAERWMRETDTDGWRLDVANEVDHAFWRRFQERVKAAKPDAWILGEIWHDAQEWLNGDQFDSVMNYPWRTAVLRFLKGESDAREFDEALCRIRHRYGPPFTVGLLNLLGSHDTARIRTLLGSQARAAMAAALLFTAVGVPLVYYGDEIGMEGEDEIDCRRCMIWDEEHQDQELWALYHRLIELRKCLPWLMDGEWETLKAERGSRVLQYRRTSRSILDSDQKQGSESALYVALNLNDREETIEFSAETPGRWSDVLEDKIVRTRSKQYRLTLSSEGFALVLHQP